MVQLAFRGYLPGFDTPRQLLETEKLYLFNLVISFVINYMTFLETILTLPVLHFVFFYFQLQVQLDGMYSNYTGKVLEGDDKEHFFSIYLNA